MEASTSPAAAGTELVPATAAGGALARLGELDGAEDLRAELDDSAADAVIGLGLPELRIEYLADPEAKQRRLKKGQLTYTLTLEQVESARFAMVGLRATRERYASAYDPKATEPQVPDCASDTAIRRTAGFASDVPPGQVCESCPHSRFNRETGEKPRCALLVRMLSWDLARSSFWLFTVKRTGLRPFRQFRSSVLEYGSRWAPQRRVDVQKLFVSARLSTADQGNHFLPVFDDFQPTPAEAFPAMLTLMRTILPAFRRYEFYADSSDADELDEPPAAAEAQPQASEAPPPARPAEARTAARSLEFELTFGPAKGRLISSLSNQELTSYVVRTELNLKRPDLASHYDVYRDTIAAARIEAAKRGVPLPTPEAIAKDHVLAPGVDPWSAEPRENA